MSLPAAPVSGQSLCHVCRDLRYVDSRPTTHSSYIIFNTSYHETVGDVRQSVGQGCRFCTLMLAGLSSHGQHEGETTVPDQTLIKLEIYMERSWNATIKTHVKQDGASFWLRMGGLGSAKDAPIQARWRVQVTPPLDSESPSPPGYLTTSTTTHLFSDLPLPLCPDATTDPDTGSERTLSLIKHWLDHCRTHHPSCQPSTPVSLPTRLVDVTTTPHPTLVQPAPSTLGTYLALSHCWGTASPPLTTTTATLPSHLTRGHGLPLAALPPTFRDAIRATRALGVPYLWIDSLCILQDSRADWSREASRMGAYFADCALVLAAAHARDSSRGLFAVRNPWGHQPCHVPGLPLPGVGVVSRTAASGWEDHDWPAAPVTALGTGRTGVWVVRDMRAAVWGEKGLPAGVGPLDGRAWTMQEQVLAGRMVRWEGWQVRWVCRGGEGCENEPVVKEVGKGERAGRVMVEWVKRLGGEDREVKEEEKDGLYREWYRTVEQYTVRAITKQFDILPAIGGLASRFEALVGDRYVAGLWVKDLHHGLLWTVEGPIQPGEQRFRAPSWSWASVNLTSIKFDKIPPPMDDTAWSKEWTNVGALAWSRDWFDVEDVSTPPASANAYGEVDGGVLTARGYIRELQLARPSVAGKVYEYRKNVLLNPETEESVGDILLDCPRMSTDAPLHVWCMPVLFAKSPDGNLVSVALALVPVEGGELHRFKRIGVAKITNKKWDHDSFPVSGKRPVCLV